MDDNAEEEVIWTEAHAKAQAEVYALCQKYFDSFLLCVQVTSQNTHKETERYSFVGGKMTAIGLASCFIHGMTKDEVWKPGNSQ